MINSVLGKVTRILILINNGVLGKATRRLTLGKTTEASKGRTAHLSVTLSVISLLYLIRFSTRFNKGDSWNESRMNFNWST
jgi:hypothetical protein